MMVPWPGIDEAASLSGAESWVVFVFFCDRPRGPVTEIPGHEGL